MMNRKTFYALSLTWGLPLNIVGGILALFLLSDGYVPKRFCGCVCFEIGERWGGLNLGLFILCQQGASDSLKSHEFGHALQNCLFGFFTPFVVHFPSAVRYHWRERKERKGAFLPPYDSVWYEAQATRWGAMFCEKFH